MNPTTATRTRRNGWWATLTLTAVLAGVAACGESTSDQAATAATATPTQAATPAALPSQDWNRLACHTLPTDMLETLDNLGDTRKAAEYAMKSSDQLMHKHGDTLERAVTVRETADLNGDQGGAVDANLDVSKAALDLAEACATLYGDGPW